MEDKVALFAQCDLVGFFASKKVNYAETHPLCTVGEQVAGEGIPQDAELVLADVLDAVEILGVRARRHAVNVPIPDKITSLLWTSRL